MLCALQSHSARTAQLVSAERVVRGNGGTIVRLAGLYTATRGAHCHYLRAAAEGRRIDSRADDTLHLIHYDDAATLAVGLLDSAAEEAVFIGIDEAHMTRQEVCDAALACDAFKHAAKPQVRVTPFTERGKWANRGETLSVTMNEAATESQSAMLLIACLVKPCVVLARQRRQDRGWQLDQAKA